VDEAIYETGTKILTPPSAASLHREVKKIRNGGNPGVDAALFDGSKTMILSNDVKRRPRGSSKN
jgi:hypothetical protein